MRRHSFSFCIAFFFISCAAEKAQKSETRDCEGSCSSQSIEETADSPKEQIPVPQFETDTNTTSEVENVGEDPNPGQVGLLVLGGHGSCLSGPFASGVLPNGMATPGFAILGDSVFAKKPRVLRSCFGVVGLDVSYEFGKEAEPPNKVAAKLFATSIVPKWTETEGISNLVIIGHSYGGWLSMEVATHLPEQVTLDLLVTVDPIDPEKCKVETYVSSLRSLFSGPVEGCDRAPIGFDSTEIGASKWLHFYQDQQRLLHSGELDGPDSSQNLTPGGLSPHARIASDKTPWSLVKEALLHP